MKQTLIGLSVHVIESANKSQIGINGKVVDETKNTIIVHTKSGNKRLMKEAVTIEVKINGITTKIQGKTIVGRIHERIKQ